MGIAEQAAGLTLKHCIALNRTKCPSRRRWHLTMIATWEKVARDHA